MKADGKLIDGHHKKLRRKGAALVNSPMRGGVRRLTINKDGEGRSGNAGMDKANEGGRETHPVESRSNEVPIEAIKGFSKVKLKEESLMVSSLERERVDNFLSDNDI